MYDMTVCIGSVGIVDPPTVYYTFFFFTVKAISILAAEQSVVHAMILLYQ